MKKQIALLLVLVMLVGALAGCGKKTDNQNTETPQTNASQTEDKNDKKPTVEPFVICGKETKYNAKGTVEETIERKYDIVTKTIIETHYNAKGNLVLGEYLFEFDAAGNRIRDTEYYVEGTKSYERETTYEYDVTGKLVCRKQYDGEGELLTEDKYEYDAAGNRIRNAEYDNDGSLRMEITYEYDEDGNRIHEVQYNHRKRILRHDYRYEYDAAGNVSRRADYNSKGELDIETKYEYDAAGNVTRTARYDSFRKRLDIETKYEYDAAGNRIREVQYKGDGSLKHDYRYEYDEAGNMTRETRQNGYEIVYADYQTVPFAAKMNVVEED